MVTHGVIMIVIFMVSAARWWFGEGPCKESGEGRKVEDYEKDG